jgi:predicted ATP-dependent protease
MAGEEDVEHAVAAQRRRAARVQERMQEAIRRGVALIDTEGARIGQVNGLSVITLAGESFGRPTRITATVRPGTGRIIDIEREVELGGPIHSKGVLILGGLLASRFSPAIPMSLHAQLVFEQSYGAVEGDSASAAEFCALVSALAEVPLRQDIAITGSLNQHGEVQAIGGVNEKIEGFFEVCAARGLTGTQGVIVPEANVQHLMLDRAVVEACAAGRFAVWPVRRVEQALALLADRPAGQRGADGLFPDGSVYRAAEDRLRRFAAWRRDWAKDERERAEREP